MFGLVGNDGSTDKTPEMVRIEALSSSNIQLIEIENNLSGGKAKVLEELAHHVLVLRRQGDEDSNEEWTRVIQQKLKELKPPTCVVLSVGSLLDDSMLPRRVMEAILEHERPC